MITKSNTIELKRINRNNIYRTIISKKQASKQEIAYYLNISIPTVTQSVNELMEIGLVEESGKFKSTGGRKAMIIACKSMARIAIGLDITRNHVNLVAVDLEANVLKSVRKRIPFQEEKEYFMLLKKMIHDLTEELDISADRVLGVGVSLPAIIGSDGKSLDYAPLLGGGKNLYQKLKGCIPYPFYFINDANAGGFAELYCSKTKRDALYISLSNSIGGAIISDGKLNEGYDRRAGEFGHMTLVPDGIPCYCGKKGCVDAYCSALLLANETDGNLGEFFEKMEAGNERYREIWDRYLNHLAIVINNLNVCYNCDIILGGYVGLYMEPYIEEIRKRVIKRCTFQTDASYLYVSKLKTEASAMGAALSYVDEFVSQI